jgi:hypothetical protein
VDAHVKLWKPRQLLSFCNATAFNNFVNNRSG